jgi:hypothetical protein
MRFAYFFTVVPRMGLAALWLVWSGCASAPKTQIPPHAVSFPGDAMITQRAVLTALWKQYTLNGYLSVSATGGKRLVVTENFGSVLADVLIKPDGKVHVMRSSKAFKEKWIRDYIAADVQCIFGDAKDANCPGRMLSPTHFVIERRWYKLDLQIVDTKPGAQPANMFDETKATKP